MFHGAGGGTAGAGVNDAAEGDGDTPVDDNPIMV